jgi:hypothetical protein
MSLPIRFFLVLTAMAPFAPIPLFCESAPCLAQNSDVNLALHANSHASAASVGLPVYPGATLYKDADNNSAADLGLTIGDFHFSVIAVKYVTTDSAAQVLAFYRKPLSRYGDVLECNQGKPAGTLTVARSGLTCGHVQVGGNTDSSTDHEMRAGSPERYRIVAIDDSHPGSTRFGLVYLELPKDGGDKTN